MSAGRHLKLLDLAQTHRIAIIEDDYDHEFHYALSIHPRARRTVADHGIGCFQGSGGSG